MCKKVFFFLEKCHQLEVSLITGQVVGEVGGVFRVFSSFGKVYRFKDSFSCVALVGNSGSIRLYFYVVIWKGEVFGCSIEFESIMEGCQLRDTIHISGSSEVGAIRDKAYGRKDTEDYDHDDEFNESETFTPSVRRKRRLG